MAAPTYFGSTSQPADNGSNADATTVTLTPPASMTAGQLVLIIAAAHDNATTLSSIGNTGGQTWSTDYDANPGTIPNIMIFRATFNGTWSASPTVVFASLSGTQPCTAVMHVFTPPAGFTNGWLLDAAPTGGSFAAGTVITINGQTPGHYQAITLAMWVVRAAIPTWGSLSGAGWAVTGDAQYRNSAGVDMSESFAHFLHDTAGPTGDVTKTQSVSVGGGKVIASWYATQAAIAFDAASNSTYQTAQSTYNWNHTCTGTNLCLFVGVSMLSVAGASVTSITYNGVNLEFVGARASLTGAIRSELWILPGPATGAHSIVVTLSAGLDSAANAVSLVNVNQGAPVEAFNSNSATNVGAADATVDVTTIADNDWVIDNVATDDTAITVGAGQTQRGNVTGTLGSGAMSTEGPKTPAGAVTMSWANVGALATWSTVAVGVIPTTAERLMPQSIM